MVSSVITLFGFMTMELKICAKGSLNRCQNDEKQLSIIKVNILTIKITFIIVLNKLFAIFPVFKLT